MRGSAYLTYILYILNFLVEGARSIASVLILDTHILKKSRHKETASPFFHRCEKDRKDDIQTPSVLVPSKKK